MIPENKSYAGISSLSCYGGGLIGFGSGGTAYVIAILFFCFTFCPQNYTLWLFPDNIENVVCVTCQILFAVAAEKGVSYNKNKLIPSNIFCIQIILAGIMWNM